MRNVPHYVEDCPTQRFTLSAPAVRRMFDEATVTETVQAIERVHRPTDAQLHAIAVQVALWTL